MPDKLHNRKRVKRYYHRERLDAGATLPSVAAAEADITSGAANNNPVAATAAALLLVTSAATAASTTAQPPYAASPAIRYTHRTIIHIQQDARGWHQDVS